MSTWIFCDRGQSHSMLLEVCSLSNRTLQTNRRESPLSAMSHRLYCNRKSNFVHSYSSSNNQTNESLRTDNHLHNIFRCYHHPLRDCNHLQAPQNTVCSIWSLYIDHASIAISHVVVLSIGTIHRSSNIQRNLHHLIINYRISLDLHSCSHACQNRTHYESLPTQYQDVVQAKDVGPFCYCVHHSPCRVRPCIDHRAISSDCI